MFWPMDPHKLLLLQVLHFQDAMRHAQANPNTANNAQRMGLPQQNGAGGLTPQGGQVAPGQGPVRTPQPQSNMPAMGPVQITPQEVQAFRARLPPQQAATTPEDQLRNYLMQQKINQRRQQMALLNHQHMETQ